MKKSKIWKLVLAVTIVFINACSDFKVETSDRSATVIPNDRLLTIASIGDYKISEDVVQKDLNDAIFTLNLQKKDSRSLNAPSFKISKNMQIKYDLPDDFCSVRSINSINYDDINFYIYDIEDEETGVKSFAITSNDRRVGEIIAICNGEFTDDAKENPFMRIVNAGIEDHILSTVVDWEEIQKLEAERSNMTNEEIISSRKYKYSEWEWHSGRVLDTRNAWHQDAPYKTAIAAIKGNSYYVAGCGPVAIAQIFAYKRYPERCSEKQYKELVSNWTPAKDWNGIYDWDLLNRGSYVVSHYISSTSNLAPGEKETFNMQVAALLYDIAENFDPIYKQMGTFTRIENVPTLLKHFGYSFDPIEDYDYDYIESSINYQHPVYMKGDNGTQGHAWVVNGYANLTCKAVNKNDKTDVVTITDNFLYCNPGMLSSFYVGYYLAGVFDFKTSLATFKRIDDAWFESLPDNRSSSMRCKYNLTMVTNISVE